MSFKNFKDESRINWGRELCDKQQLPNNEIQLGAIMRIADAVEVMAKNHQQLIDERDRYKKWYEDGGQRREKLYRQISGLRGYITRLKKKK